MAKPHSPFRSPVSKARLIKQLFYEHCYGQDEKLAVYTLKDHDHNGYPSLYLLYMAKGDLTEWEFAEEYLDGHEHWTMLCAAKWFQPYVARWREELELKVRAKALRAIAEVATNPEHKSSYEANKFLVTGAWKAPKGTKGRPSKEQVKAEAEKLAKEQSDLAEDAERIGLLN